MLENTLREYWGDSSEPVMIAIESQERKPMTTDEFMSHCVACGGDWGAMLLTGIKKLWPAVYDAIPAKMGRHAFFALCEVLNLLGVAESLDD